MSTVVEPCAEARPRLETASLAAAIERPPLASNAVVGTVIYLVTALMLFAGFASAYLVLRAAAPAWPPAGQPRLPLGVTAANSAVLLASGILVLRSRSAPDHFRQAHLLYGAAALGAVFLAVQGFEWVRLVRFGFVMSAGPYASTFYTLVGAHALHALGGLAILAVTARRVARGRGNLAAGALYWGFVVAIWPVLYALLFLL